MGPAEGEIKITFSKDGIFAWRRVMSASHISWVSIPVHVALAELQELCTRDDRGARDRLAHHFAPPQPDSEQGDD